MAENDIAIHLKDVKKVYKLYRKPKDRLLDAFGLLRGKRKPGLNYALKGVSLDIKKGETVGIIGTNGSGKSTILKIITGVLFPNEGDVEINGRISALLELGAGFNAEYTGIENVYLNGTMLGFTDEEIEAKLPQILEFADIGDYVYQPVKTYSSGMFVRLAFAVAINIDPEILIVDEALSVGDTFFQAKCYKKFDEFKRQGKTIVFVSHDLSSISKYCDKVFLLNKGNLLGEGSAKDMIDIYKQVLVGQYDTGEDASDTKKKDEQSDIKMILNPNTEEYGNGQAYIKDIYFTDEGGRRTNTIIKGTKFSIHVKVKFEEFVPEPIFAFTFTDVKGTDITGTNTMLERAFTDSAQPGDVIDITYTQVMNLQGGNYLLSLGVTGHRDANFEVYHRLYYCLDITVVSDKDTVGYYDMMSDITVEKQKSL
ncbi:MAG: ABC transporter ATP-binding protein [Lachnospiraceae bacterium]|nr:ABC transporter ATP-binding protein [Lachnospiraceae bacterium]